jgi:hypothetical protein
LAKQEPSGAMVSDQQQNAAALALEAIATALEAAVDLSQPHRTTVRCLTISARVSAARTHGPEWLAGSLDRLVHEWRIER